MNENGFGVAETLLILLILTALVLAFRDEGTARNLKS